MLGYEGGRLPAREVGPTNATHKVERRILAAPLVETLVGPTSCQSYSWVKNRGKQELRRINERLTTIARSERLARSVGDSGAATQNERQLVRLCYSLRDTLRRQKLLVCCISGALHGALGRVTKWYGADRFGWPRENH